MSEPHVPRKCKREEMTVMMTVIIPVSHNKLPHLPLHYLNQLKNERLMINISRLLARDLMGLTGSPTWQVYIFPIRHFFIFKR